MTDREKAIVMAYTGVCMLTGEKINKYYAYVDEIMGRPVYTHEMAIKAVDDKIKEKAKPDFLELCKETDTKGSWIPDKDDGYTCDDCGTWSTRASKYCPDCGRRMEVEDNE